MSPVVPRWTGGPLGHGAHVERAVHTLLKAWETTYLSDVERVEGLDSQSLPVARSWDVGGDFDWRPQQHLPLVLVYAEGLTDVETDAGREEWWATLALNVYVVVEDQSFERAELVSHRLLAAHRACLIDHPTIDGACRAVEWLDDDYQVLEHQRRRVAACGASFEVGVKLGGEARVPPAVPPPNPYSLPPDGPVVQTTGVDLDPILTSGNVALTPPEE